jgi:hypothetical protein
VNDQRFEFRFTTPYRLAGLPFGVTPSTCEVHVGAGRLLARFGPWQAHTALENVSILTDIESLRNRLPPGIRS